MNLGVTCAIQRPSMHMWSDPYGFNNWFPDYASWRLKVHRDPPAGATAGKREQAAKDTWLPAPLLPPAGAALLLSVLYWASR